jgi:hypothetical protein
MSGHNPTDPDYPPRKHGWRYNLLGVLIFLLFFLVLAGVVWYFGLSHLFFH